MAPKEEEEEEEIAVEVPPQEASDVEQPVPVEQSVISVEEPIDLLEHQTLDAIQVEDDDDEATVHWKTSPFAVGKVQPTWNDDLVWVNEEGTSCSLPITPLVCRRTGRVGNMAVLYQRTPKEGPPQLVLVAGPFWFVTWGITVPLIVGVNLLIYFRYIRCYETLWLELVWGLLLACLLGCLLTASLSNPGILVRQIEPLEEWVWNDQALTFRPLTAKYDTTCALVVEGFDHVCPWVGTAIGAGNMRWFKRFLVLIVVDLVFNLGLLFFADCS